MGNRLTQYEFIERCFAAHGDKYDYSNANYVRTGVKVEIICRDHGPFFQEPSSHIRGVGCPKCGNEKTKSALKKDLSTFVSESIKVHGLKYKYSNVNYISIKHAVSITCPIHGDFMQTPECHIIKRHGCVCCGIDEMKLSKTSGTSDFIAKATELHGCKYDYTFVNYVHSTIPVKIKCDRGHVYMQRPSNHLNGSGCKECARQDNTGGYSYESIMSNSLLYNKPCTFYHVKILNKKENIYFYKIGITTQTVKQRFSGVNKNDFEIESLYEYNSTLANCYDLEQLILSELAIIGKLYKVKHFIDREGERIPGWTECYY